MNRNGKLVYDEYEQLNRMRAKLYAFLATYGYMIVQCRETGDIIMTQTSENNEGELLSVVLTVPYLDETSEDITE
jgi:hypothetical protein